MSDAVDIAVRALARPVNQKARRRARRQRKPSEETARFPDAALIFDTETSSDELQRLNFGVWRYCRVDVIDGEVAFDCVAEGIFYADDLPDRDPEGYRTLVDYGRTRQAWVDVGAVDANSALTVEPLSGWLERVLWRAAFKLRAAVVCFNSPFDLSRIAWQAGETRTYKPEERIDAFEGGFSFAVWSYEREGQRVESRYRPRVAIKSIDSKRSLKGFRSPNLPPDADDRRRDGEARREWRFTGHFLDLRTLVFALTDRSHSLESASRSFDFPYVKRDVEHGQITTDYITYCREDVAATERLGAAALTEFLRHPIPLQATRAYSPATIGKGYLKEMGVAPPADRHNIDPRTLGWAMSAYYGGRAEVRIRRTSVPVVYVDFKSMYPSVCALMNVWDLLIAQTIEARDATSEVQRLLSDINAEACFEPDVWAQFVGIAQIIPDGDVVPVRGRYGAGPSWQIGVNPITSEQPMWFTIPDLIASKLLTGKTPRVLRAIRFVGEGQIPDLRPVDLLGATRVDPNERDFFRTVIEQRTLAKNRGDENTSKGLKTLANATSYGIYAQMTRRELGDNRRENVIVYGLHDEPHEHRIANPEEPGEYAFPPVAAAITGAARLLLALVENEVASAGGTYAFCDTDSMAIVATRPGGLVACDGGPHVTPDGRHAIRALTWEQVETVRQRFTALNPYDPAIAPGSILELEDENYAEDQTRHRLHCYAVSAKRYTFFLDHPNGPRLVKPSQHGLGHLLNPTDPAKDDRDWIADTWRWLLRRALELPIEEPPWFGLPAVGRLTVSSPHIYGLLHELNAERSYGEQVKPFNFLLIALVHPLERPATEQQMVLIAPYSSDPERWSDLPWTNRYSAQRFAITATPSNGHERGGLVTVKTYRNVLAEYAAHPESKSADPNGRPCNRQTRGLLARRHLSARTVTHIGKEANSLDEGQAGLVRRQGEVLNAYDDTEQLLFQEVVLPILRRLGVREVVRRTGHSLGAVHAVLNGRSIPRPAARERYRRALATNGSCTTGADDDSGSGSAAPRVSPRSTG